MQVLEQVLQLPKLASQVQPLQLPWPAVQVELSETTPQFSAAPVHVLVLTLWQATLHAPHCDQAGQEHEPKTCIFHFYQIFIKIKLRGMNH